MPTANAPTMPTQGHAPTHRPLHPVADMSNGPSSIAAFPLPSSSPKSKSTPHTPVHTRTPHSIAKQLCALELNAPTLYPGLAALWYGLEETRAAILREYLEVQVAPEGVCVVTFEQGKRVYARAQSDRAVFEGKKSMGLGRAGSPQHRAYEQRVAKRDALAEFSKFEDAARAMVQGASALAEAVSLKSCEATKIEQPAKKLRALSFFTGCMGLDLGVEQAGFEVIAACELPTSLRKPHESRSRAQDTIRLNRPDLFIYQGIETYDFPAEHCGIDLVFGGPPCQSWSTAGKRLGAIDERGKLLQKYADVIVRLKPRTFILENVLGLATYAAGGVLKELIGFFENAGYFVTNQIANAFDFGVAQHRKRLILIGSMSFAPPKLSGKRKHLNLREAFAGLNQPILEAVPVSPCVLEAIATGAAKRLTWDKPATTMKVKISGDRRSPYAHPEEDRTLSVAECLRLQGFPDNWQLAGSVRDKFLQLGNAVPVPLAYAAAMSARQTITEIENKEPAKEMPVANFNPAALRGVIAPSAVVAQPVPKPVVEQRLAGPKPSPRWLDSLNPETREVALAAMRKIREKSDWHLEQNRKAQPKFGETLIGNTDIDDLIMGESLSTFLLELGRGRIPSEAMDKAKEMAELVVSKFNSQEQKSRATFSETRSGLQVWKKSGQSNLDGVLLAFISTVHPLTEPEPEEETPVANFNPAALQSAIAPSAVVEPSARPEAKANCKKEPSAEIEQGAVAITDASVQLNRDFGLICNPNETRWQWQDLTDPDEPVIEQVYPSRELATCAAIEALKTKKVVVAQRAGYGAVSEIIRQWVEKAFPAGLPVEVVRPVKEAALIDSLERLAVTGKTADFYAIKKTWEKCHSAKITPKPIRSALLALCESGEIEPVLGQREKGASVPNVIAALRDANRSKKEKAEDARMREVLGETVSQLPCELTEIQWQLTPLYARRLAAYELSLQPEVKAPLHISIEQGCLAGGAATLYTFQPTLAGVKAAIAHAKSAKFSKLLCETLTKEQAATFKPQLTPYGDRAAAPYRKPSRTPRKLAGPKERPTGMSEAAFRAEWSVYLEHGKIALEQSGEWWVLDIEGHGQSTSKDLGLLSMCLENIEMQLSGKSAAALKWQRDTVRKAAANPNAKRLAEGIAKKEALAASWAEGVVRRLGNC